MFLEAFFINKCLTYYSHLHCFKDRHVFYLEQRKIDYKGVVFHVIMVCENPIKFCRPTQTATHFFSC